MGILHRIKKEILRIEEVGMDILASLMLTSESGRRDDTEFIIGFMQVNDNKSKFSFSPIYEYSIETIEEALNKYNQIKEKIKKKEYTISKFTQEITLMINK